MPANSAQYGAYTVHGYWIGAIPAMVFLGLVMTPFYYGSKVRSVPEFLLLRFDRPAHLLSSILFDRLHRAGRQGARRPGTRMRRHSAPLSHDAIPTRSERQASSQESR